jgi:ABC-2 type transport system ATP-binding protein
MSISVSNLTKKYGEQIAVNNISFSVPKGAIVGFLGPNGAGKSTTMKMITGYLASDEGQIQVAGIPVEQNNTATKAKIGYLPEANPLYYDMYIREYLQFVAQVHAVQNIPKAIDNAIQTVGLQVEAHKKIGELSKGYKQRVGLAAALIHEPEILILDEPTSGLDPNQIIEIRNVIKTLAQNKTVLFSSHILQEVEAICDSVIIINKGNIVANDTLSNLRNANNSSQKIVVQFAEQVSAVQLQQLAFAGAITQQGAAFYITTQNATELRKAIVNFSVEQNLNIVSLQNETTSLENIFSTLTNN